MNIWSRKKMKETGKTMYGVDRSDAVCARSYKFACECCKT